MKKLQNKILKKVYSFETKRTAAELFLRIGLVAAIVAAGVWVFSIILKELVEQQTLDLLELFHEDAEIIREYFGDVANTIYEEIPKNEIMILIVLSITFVLLVLFFVKNFGRIKNKIRSLKKYWTQV